MADTLVLTLNLLILISYMVAPSIVAFAIYWFWIRKGKCKIYITVPFGNVRRIIKTKKRHPLTKLSYDYKVDKKDNKYTIDLEQAILDESNRPIMFFDRDTTDPLTFNKSSLTDKYSQTFKTIVENNASSKLLHGYKDKVYLLIIIGLVIGICVIGLYAIYTSNSQNLQLLRLLNQTKTTVVK